MFLGGAVKTCSNTSTIRNSSRIETFRFANHCRLNIISGKQSEHFRNIARSGAVHAGQGERANLQSSREGLTTTMNAEHNSAPAGGGADELLGY